MKTWSYFILGLGVLVLFACGPRDDAVRVEKHNGQELFVCDYFKVKDTPVTLKLSEMVEPLEIIKLENDTNAMIGYSKVYLSENYMLLRPDRKSPVKLFTRQGKFLNDIGKIGRGPGEYTTVYDMQIDEGRGLIYFLPWSNNVLYCYDLKGNFKSAVPLAGRLPKGKFIVQDSLLKVVALPFNKGVKWAAFCQNFNTGQLLDSVAAAPYAVSFDYGNELYGDWDNNSVYFFVWKGKQDSLYRYEPGKNSLTPCFTVDYHGIEEIPIHEYRETGDYFWFTTSTIVPTGERTSTNKTEKSILVDKKNRTATSSYNVENDYLGYYTSLWSFSNGYYTENISPIRLKKKLEKAAKRDDLSREVQKRISDLLADIDEEGNNYVIIGKMK